QVLEPKIIDLNAILDSLNPMLRRLIGEDIELQTVKAQGLGFVRADPAQLEQVVLNLIVNARDAMPRGGRVTIETANVTLGEDYASIHPETAPGPHVMLAVSDTGVGMTPEVREKIFEPFFTTKEVGQGSGLGLATVYGIVKQTGGSIWVYSEPGLGTTFKVYLPQILGEVAASEETLPSRKIRGTETILVVEDEAEVRELARRILESAGYRVTVAANAGEALAEAERIGASFQLLLTDVVMPKMNGKELSERLCRLCPSLKVLFTSGYPDNAIAHHGVLEPGTEYLAKPFGPQDLLRRVREVLDSPAPKRTGL
ncbi:MAG: ATP-binding protein, partial [Polyangia bacterium]|nr:ATP-binding protein [Polyangia bacterium]